MFFAGCIFLRAYTYTVERRPNDACTNCWVIDYSLLCKTIILCYQMEMI